MDPIAAAQKMLEVGRQMMPEKSHAESLGPLITSVASAYEKLATAQNGPTAEIWKLVVPLVPPLLTKMLTPAPAPKDDFLEKLVLMREAGLLSKGAPTHVQHALT